MAYQTYFSGNSATTPATGDATYKSYFGAPTVIAPSASALATMRGAVPAAGDKENLTVALSNLDKYSPEDKVRVVQRASQAGIVDKNRATGYITGTLNNNAPAPLKLNAAQNAVQGTINYAKQIPGAAGTLGHAITQIPNAISGSEQVTARGVARLGPNGLADVYAQQAQAENANRIVQNTIAARNAGKITPEMATRIIKNAAGSASQATKQQTETLKSMPTRGQLAAGIAGTAADVLTLGTLKAGGVGLKAGRELPAVIKGTGVASKVARIGSQSGSFAAASGLTAGATGGTKKDIAIAAAAGGALPLIGRGAGKAYSSVKQAFKDGPQQLLENSKVSRLVDAGREANKPVKVSVQDTSMPHSVSVRTPTRAALKEISTTDKINVRTPNRMSDKQFHSEFNKMSSTYNKETKQLEAASKTLSPQAVKAAGNALDTKYQKQLNGLLDRYHNPELTPKVAPKQISTKTTNAKVVTTKVATSKVAPKSVPKTTPKVTETPIYKASEPKVSTPAEGGVKISGSALKTEQKAVEAHLTKEFEDKATYSSGSYKQESENAVKLVHEDPKKAMDIAMGTKAGNNTMHEVAVARALERKALKEGDVGTLQRLASSVRHTETSKAAQRLGAEGFNVDHNSPVKIMQELSAVRQKVAEKRLKQGLASATSDEVKAIRAAKVAPSKQDWHSFIQELRCK